MRFTAFVDEYYYETSPTDPSETAVNGLWKKFVNQQARVMNILSNLAYSPDRQSTKTNAIYSIRQSSIQTMYNIMDEENFTAWGTEMIQEETPVAFEKTRTTFPTRHTTTRTTDVRIRSGCGWAAVRPNAGAITSRCRPGP